MIFYHTQFTLAVYLILYPFENYPFLKASDNTPQSMAIFIAIFRLVPILMVLKHIVVLVLCCGWELGRNMLALTVYNHVHNLSRMVGDDSLYNSCLSVGKSM